MILQNIHLFTIIAPLLMGFLSFVSKDKLGKFTNYIFLCCFVAIFAITLMSIFDLNLLKGKVYYIVVGGWKKAIGIELKVNLIRIIFSLSLSLIAMLFFATNLDNKISYAIRGFACIMICGGNGIIMTNDIFNSYVFFEIVCITSYIFYAHTNKAECIKNAYNYMILSGFAGIIFLFVAGILYQITGQLNIDLIHTKILELKTNKTLNALYIIFILTMLFKLGIYPLHNILFGIYKHLNPRYLSLVSGVSAIVYAFFILKIILLVFGESITTNNNYLDISLKIFGSIGFVFFSLMSFSTEFFIKFIISLAFAQTSLFAMCLSYLPDNTMIIGLCFSIISQAVLKVCLLCFTNNLQYNCDIWQLKKTQLCNITPVINKYILTILVFLISGMPFSMVFISKWYILSSIINTYESIIWVCIILLGFTIEIIACFAVMMRILSKNNTSTSQLTIKGNFINIVAIVFAILFVIIVAFYTTNLKNLSI